MKVYAFQVENIIFGQEDYKMMMKKMKIKKKTKMMKKRKKMKKDQEVKVVAEVAEEIEMRVTMNQLPKMSQHGLAFKNVTQKIIIKSL